MLVRDTLVARVFIGPVDYFSSQNVLYVTGQAPILLPYLDKITSPPAESSQSQSKSPIIQHKTYAEENSPITSVDSAPVETKKSKVPRPPNAFIIYRKHHHASTVAAHPGAHNNQICKSTWRSYMFFELTSCSANHW
jgi:hypothetical protein